MRKRVKKKATKKRAAPKKKVKSAAKKESNSKSVAANKKAHWNVFKELHRQVDNAWSKLKSDLKNNAKPEALIHDKNNLLLLLGECNYMARECMSFAAKRRKR